MILKAATTPEEEVTSSLYNLAKQYDLLPEILTIVQNGDESHTLFVDVLKLVAESETPEDVFTSNVINEHWRTFRVSLNETDSKSRFQALVGKLASSQEYTKDLMASDGGFDPSDSLLYLDILRGAEGKVPEFVAWCKEGVQLMTKDEWLTDFGGNNANCAVCIELTKQNNGPSLTNYFSDALQEHGQSVICLLYTSPSPRDGLLSRMPSSA